MNRFLRYAAAIWLAAVVALPFAQSPVANAATIAPSYDLWLRGSAPDTVYENDAMWVAEHSAYSEDRWGIAEWDLSGLPPITSAYMQFAPRTRADAGATQVAYQVADGIAGLTYNGYLATKSGTETPLESLGHFTVPAAGVPWNRYSSGQFASATDLALLNSLRTGSGKLAISFKAGTGAIEWNDGANLGGPGYAADLPIRLVINEPLPSEHVLQPTRDRWIRQRSPNSQFEDDAMWVSKPPATPTNDTRWGVAEWDLSGLDEIVDAHMEFNPRTRADGDAVQIAFVIPDGIDTLTWNTYQSTKLASEVALEGLGGITLPSGGLPLGLYAIGNEATPADMALLNMLRTTTGKVTVAFKAATGAMEWDDGANAGGPGLAQSNNSPVLLVMHTVPEPATLSLAATGFTALLLWRRRR